MLGDSSIRKELASALIARHRRSVGCRDHLLHGFYYEFRLIQVDPVAAFVGNDVPSANGMPCNGSMFIKSHLRLMASGEYSHGNLGWEWLATEFGGACGKAFQIFSHGPEKCGSAPARANHADGLRRKLEQFAQNSSYSFRCSRPE